MKALLTVLFCVIASQVIQAEDSIETKYYEAAVNGAKEINLKSWKTYRAGKLVHEYTETDLVRDGTFPKNDEVFYSSGKKVFQVATLKARRAIFFHPEPGISVAQIDEDSDGLIEMIIFSNTDGETIEIFRRSKQRFAPVSDAELKKTRADERMLMEALKAFDEC